MYTEVEKELRLFLINHPTPCIQHLTSNTLPNNYPSHIPGAFASAGEPASFPFDNDCS